MEVRPIGTTRAGSIVAAVALVASACTAAGTPPTTTTTQAPVLTTVAPEPTTPPPSTAPSTPSSTSAPPTTVPLEDLSLRLVEVDSGFSFPVLLRADPAGGADLVVEQPGRIVRADGGDHAVVLDITDDVRFDGEQGLLGLAFHPDFAANGLAYVNYVETSGNTVVEEFRVEGGSFAVGSRRVVLEVEQPAANHNGGMLEFGPSGYLWIGMGDGGAADDRFGNGQRADTLLGSMLRIAVGVPGSTYAIPPDNPFVDGGGRPEVWAIGLRNPWRFAIDGDDVWIADVGQGAVEEIDLADARIGGLNYGWPIMEGDVCFREDGCSTEGLTMPVVVYGHDEGCSITGGRVYRGEAIPELQGHFFFSDYCTGFMRSYQPGSPGPVDWTDSTGPVEAVTAFGTGGDGELYVVSHRGSIYRIEASR